MPLTDRVAHTKHDLSQCSQWNLAQPDSKPSFRIIIHCVQCRLENVEERWSKHARRNICVKSNACAVQLLSNNSQWSCNHCWVTIKPEVPLKIRLIKFIIYQHIYIVLIFRMFFVCRVQHRFYPVTTQKANICMHIVPSSDCIIGLRSFPSKQKPILEKCTHLTTQDKS